MTEKQCLNYNCCSLGLTATKIVRIRRVNIGVVNWCSVETEGVTRGTPELVAAVSNPCLIVFLIVKEIQKWFLGEVVFGGGVGYQGHKPHMFQNRTSFLALPPSAARTTNHCFL